MEWNLDGGVNLKTKVFILWIWVLLRKNSRLSLDELYIKVSSAWIFVQIQDIAASNTQVVFEPEHFNPELND